MTVPLSVLRVATLNCLNLALPGRPVYPGWRPYEAQEYLAKTQWLARMLDRLAADFVLLQEVFHAQALSDVLRQTMAQGRQWSFAVPHAGQDNLKPRLGLAWRAPWQPAIDSIVDLPPGAAVPVPECGEHRAFSRPLLRARVPLVTPRCATTLTLLNVHLKSRRPQFAPGEDETDPRRQARGQLRALLMRAAEAAALRQLAFDELIGAAAPLIVGGDFNDEAGAVTTRMVADTSCTSDDRVPCDALLFNAVDLERQQVPGRGRDVAYTFLHGGVPERIDHVLLSAHFVPGTGHAIGQVGAVRIFNDHLAERRRLPGAERDGTDLGRILSDHAALCVDIVLDRLPA